MGLDGAFPDKKKALAGRMYRKAFPQNGKA